MFLFWQQLLSLRIISQIEVMSGRELRMLGVLSCGQVRYDISGMIHYTLRMGHFLWPFPSYYLWPELRFEFICDIESSCRLFVNSCNLTWVRGKLLMQSFLNFLLQVLNKRSLITSVCVTGLWTVIKSMIPVRLHDECACVLHVSCVTDLLKLDWCMQAVSEFSTYTKLE